MGIAVVGSNTDDFTCIDLLYGGYTRSALSLRVTVVGRVFFRMDVVERSLFV